MRMQASIIVIRIITSKKYCDHHHVHEGLDVFPVPEKPIQGTSKTLVKSSKRRSGPTLNMTTKILQKCGKFKHLEFE
jgi:hypothetical protein